MTEIYYQLGQSNPSGFLRQDRALSTQLVKIKSREILTPIARANHVSVDALASKVHPSVLEESEVLRIEVDDKSRARAQAMVGAITDAYLKVARQDSLDDVLKARTQDLDEVNRQINDLNAQLGNAATSAQQAAVQSQLSNLDDRKTSLQSTIDELTTEQAERPTIEQITQPYLLDSPVSPKPMKAAVAGGLAGFALVAVAAMFLAAAAPRRPARLMEQTRTEVGDSIADADTGREVAESFGVAGWTLVSRGSWSDPRHHRRGGARPDVLREYLSSDEQCPEHHVQPPRGVAAHDPDRPLARRRARQERTRRGQAASPKVLSVSCSWGSAAQVSSSSVSAR